MSIAAVVTRGYGSWGSVAEVVTRGYAIAEVTVPTAPGVEFTLPNALMHHTMTPQLPHYTMDQEGSG